MSDHYVLHQIMKNCEQEVLNTESEIQQLKEKITILKEKKNRLIEQQFVLNRQINNCINMEDFKSKLESEQFVDNMSSKYDKYDALKISKLDNN